VFNKDSVCPVCSAYMDCYLQKTYIHVAYLCIDVDKRNVTQQTLMRIAYSSTDSKLRPILL